MNSERVVTPASEAGRGASGETSRLPAPDAAIEPDLVHEQWRVLDLWWTEEPIVRQYRDVTRGDRRLVEFRERDAATREWLPWQENDPASGSTGRVIEEAESRG